MRQVHEQDRVEQDDNEKPAADLARRPIITTRVSVDENARVLAALGRVREAQRAQQRGMAKLQRAKAAVATAEADVADLGANLAAEKESADDAIRIVKMTHDIPGDGGWDDVTRVISRVPRK